MLDYAPIHLGQWYFILIRNVNMNGDSIQECLVVLKQLGVAALVLLWVSGCNNDSGGNSSCDKPLTINYINSEIAGFPGFSATGTKIVRTDGKQGNSYDINQIAVSRISYETNDSLAFAFTIYGTAEPPAGTYIAFYLDVDKSALTGLAVDKMGADALVVNAPGGAANGFFVWSGTDWVKQPIVGSLGSNASYFQGCTFSTTVYAPMYAGLSALYGVDVTGVVSVVTIPDSDPTVITSILDQTAMFNFTVP